MSVILRTRNVPYLIKEFTLHPKSSQLAFRIFAPRPSRRPKALPTAHSFGIPPTPPTRYSHRIMLSRILPTVHCDAEKQPSLGATALSSVRTAVSIPENELKRWRRTFDAHAKTINGEK